MSILQWIDLDISIQEMNPSNTLTIGQCFNWKKLSIHPDETQFGYWIGVLDGTPLIVKQGIQTSYVLNLMNYCSSSVLSSNVKIEDLKRESDSENPKKKQKKMCFSETDQQSGDNQALKGMMRDYFQTNHSLSVLYQLWSSNCERMKIITSCLPGVRVVRQDPWECLVSFICSSNNNISRITLMLDRLRKTYGNYLCSIIVNNEGNRENEILKVFQFPVSERNDRENCFHLYSFPTQAVLSSLSEGDLKSLGFGYRAKFIIESSKLLESKPSNFLLNLRKYCCLSEEDKLLDPDNQVSKLREYRTMVQSELLEFMGVGNKVADCVALFSLDQAEIIPIDTHVWSIAMRDYAKAVLSSDKYEKLSQKKSLTPVMYEDVSSIFRRLFQEKAGWAHSVLFAAELPLFRQLLPHSLQLQMKEFDDQMRLRKKELKLEKSVKKS
jgi:N-glycosylase/DNA lyase